MPAGPYVHLAYLRHHSEQTPLYRVVAAHAQTFIAPCKAAGTPLPRFVEEEFNAYLVCGILAHGFIRLTCDTCHHETLAAFSCKRRGFCPSCGTRRIAQGPRAGQKVLRIVGCGERSEPRR